MKRRTLLGLLPALLVAPGGLCAPPETDFSGTWKQSNERSTPPRSGDVTLRIDHHDPDLTVETAIVRGPSAPRRTLQHYTTNGRTYISTGTDGDEFHARRMERTRSRFLHRRARRGTGDSFPRDGSLMDGGAAIERRRERALDQAASRRLFISGKRRHVKAKRIPCHSSMK